MNLVRQPDRKQKSSYGLVVFINLLATVHVVWFYLARVECYIKLPAYEQGRERTPFQYRLMLMSPLRWAHHSHGLNALAAWLTSQRAWFPNGLRPEGILQAAVDLTCVCLAGLVARKLYLLSSRTGLLTPYVYPLTLLMVLSTYSLQTMHAYRFIYDLPALAFFSLGLYCIYARKRYAWLACVFIVGTMNRETTLLLLVFFVLAQCSRNQCLDWRQSYAAGTLKVVLPLGLFWVGWRLFVDRLFTANATVGHPKIWLNTGTLLIPFSWPQLLATYSYLLPLVVACRRNIDDPTLRAWLYALPVWFVFMLYYGVVIETRIFGELIAYLACICTLIAEEKLLLAMRQSHGLANFDSPDPARRN